MVQREKEMPEIQKIQAYWERFGHARALAGVEIGKCWDTLSLGGYHGTDDKVMAMECLEYEFSSCSPIPYGHVLYRYDAERMVNLADLLGCSLDYLLCRTDDPKGFAHASELQATGQMVVAGWMPGGTTPAEPCEVIAVFDLGDNEKASKQFLQWTGSQFTFKNGVKVDMEPLKWMRLPPDEGGETNGKE